MTNQLHAWRLWSLLLLMGLFAPAAAGADETKVPELEVRTISSTIDGAEQPVRVSAPESATTRPTPLLISLHTWSSDYRQDRSPWVREAVQRGWIYVQPNFRGRNDKPAACGSELARQDVLDALDWARRTWQVDDERIYLAGVSGGGHMTMLMAGYYPERFSAISAWVGISDLAEWYRFHSSDGEVGNYARMVAACCDGAPGTSAKVDAEYASRSPINFIARVGDLRVDLNAGVKDGKSGSVPIHHTLRAFNAIAAAGGYSTISDAEMDYLWENGRLESPLPGDEDEDPTYGREIWLRREAGPARVTIFEGGHEAVPEAACAWLEQQSRKTRHPE
ncbi:Prolyl oligopeptidase family protein [Maioricimonas rarisocia]|uniref:Prolyl oligopeptidase family protein n=1 Tax=Maioricimonas rarisocia TaxID=2528026 RepID=A0A517ZBX1_9PLAN|nr:prolyl oligopeptidase family serine peptidase [Maioricimonas rarisocia]QDU39939.1 Prolyl oligopeptidase family protein [Maioricimonas rarisocia]